MHTSDDGLVRRSIRTIQVPAVLLLAALLPYLPALLRGEIPFFWDLSDHWYPYRLVAHQARSAGELAHWCPQVFCGIDNTSQVDGGGLLYPVHWLSDRFHPAHTLLPQLVLHRFLLGVLGYLTARAFGVRRLAGLLAGIVFVMGGTTSSGLTQPAVLRTLAWLPVFPLGMMLVVRGRSMLGASILAAGGATAFVAGYPTFVLITCAMLPLLLLLARGLPRTASDWSARGRALAVLVLGGTVAILLAAPQLLATSGAVPESQRAFGLTPEFVDDFHAVPRDLLLLFLPRFAEDVGVARSGFAYVGSAVIALAGFAVIRGRRGAVACVTTAVLGAILALGQSTPIGTLVWSLPGLEYFRNPCHYLLLWTYGLTLAAACGADELLRTTSPGRRLVAVSAVPLLAVGVAWVVWGELSGAEMRRLALTLLGLGLLALCAVPRVPRRALPVLLLLAVAVDVGTFRVTFPAAADRTKPVSEIVVGEPSAERVAAHHAAQEHLQPPRGVTSDKYFNWDNRVTTSGVDNVRGLSSLVPYRTMDVSRIIEVGEPFPRVPLDQPLYDYGPLRALDSPLLDLLALRYALGFPNAPATSGWTRIGPMEWERDAVDPVRFVPRVIEVAPGTDGWRHFVEPAFDPVTTAVVETAEPLELGLGGRPGTVDAYERGPNDTRLTVTADERSLLLRTVTHAAGWTATIDGEDVPLLRANHAFQAIVVPPGRHEVEFRYEPPRWRTGLVVSGIGFLLWLGLCVLAWREHVRLRSDVDSEGATEATRPEPA